MSEISSFGRAARERCNEKVTFESVMKEVRELTILIPGEPHAEQKD